MLLARLDGSRLPDISQERERSSGRCECHLFPSPACPSGHARPTTCSAGYVSSLQRNPLMSNPEAENGIEIGEMNAKIIHNYGFRISRLQATSPGPGLCGWLQGGFRGRKFPYKTESPAGGGGGAFQGGGGGASRAGEARCEGSWLCLLRPRTAGPGGDSMRWRSSSRCRGNHRTHDAAKPERNIIRVTGVSGSSARLLAFCDPVFRPLREPVFRT